MAGLIKAQSGKPEGFLRRIARQTKNLARAPMAPVPEKTGRKARKWFTRPGQALGFAS